LATFPFSTLRALICMVICIVSGARLKRERFSPDPFEIFFAVFCRLINPDQAN